MWLSGTTMYLRCCYMLNNLENTVSGYKFWLYIDLYQMVVNKFYDNANGVVRE